MSEVPTQQILERLQKELKEASEEVSRKDENIWELEAQLLEANSTLEEYRQLLNGQKKELADQRMKAELTTLRALEDARRENQKLLNTERQQRKDECQRFECWISDLKSSFAGEKGHLLERIAELKGQRLVQSSHTGMSLETSLAHELGQSEETSSYVFSVPKSHVVSPLVTFSTCDTPPSNTSTTPSISLLPGSQVSDMKTAHKFNPEGPTPIKPCSPAPDQKQSLPLISRCVEDEDGLKSISRVEKSNSKKTSETGVTRISGKTDSTLAVKAPTSSTTTETSLASKFAPPAGSWECDTCMVRNEAKFTICVACSTPKPGAQPPSKTVEVTKLSLAAKFAPPAGSWECGVCMVPNKSDASACVACSTPRPGSKKGSDPGLASSTLAAKFAPSTSTWVCDICMVVNKTESFTCVACTSLKPGLSVTSSTGSSGLKLGGEGLKLSGKLGGEGLKISGSVESKLGTKGGLKLGSGGGLKLGNGGGLQLGTIGGVKFRTDGGLMTGRSGGLKLGTEGGIKLGTEGGVKLGTEGGLKHGTRVGLKFGTERGLKLGTEGGLKLGKEGGLPEERLKLGTKGELKCGTTRELKFGERERLLGSGVELNYESSGLGLSLGGGGNVKLGEELRFGAEGGPKQLGEELKLGGATKRLKLGDITPGGILLGTSSSSISSASSSGGSGFLGSSNPGLLHSPASLVPSSSLTTGGLNLGGGLSSSLFRGSSSPATGKLQGLTFNPIGVSSASQQSLLFGSSSSSSLLAGTSEYSTGIGQNLLGSSTEFNFRINRSNMSSLMNVQTLPTFGCGLIGGSTPSASPSTLPASPVFHYSPVDTLGSQLSVGTSTSTTTASTTDLKRQL